MAFSRHPSRQCTRALRRGREGLALFIMIQVLAACAHSGGPDEQAELASLAAAAPPQMSHPPEAAARVAPSKPSTTKSADAARPLEMWSKLFGSKRWSQGAAIGAMVGGGMSVDPVEPASATQEAGGLAFKMGSKKVAADEAGRVLATVVEALPRADREDALVLSKAGSGAPPEDRADRSGSPARVKASQAAPANKQAEASTGGEEVDLLQLLDAAPTAAGPQRDDYTRYLQGLRQASYATRFSTPLVTDESFVFTAAVAPDMQGDALSGLLERMDEPDAGQVAVARAGTLRYDSRMSAALEGGDAFAIKPLDESSTKRVGSGMVTVWRWNVTPQRPGLQRRLVVRFYIVPAQAEGKDATEVKLLSRAVSVDWTWSWLLRQQTFQYLAGGIGAVLSVLLGWALKRFFGEGPRAKAAEPAKSPSVEEPLPRILP